MNQHGHDQPIPDQYGHDKLDEHVQDAQGELDEPVDDNPTGCHFSVNLTLPSCYKMAYQAR
jgi:hypothetical protein